MEGLKFSGRFMTKEGKKRFLRDWELKKEELNGIGNGPIKIEIPELNVIFYAKNIEEAKENINEAGLVQKIINKK
jgi:hypothetical protein